MSSTGEIRITKNKKGKKLCGLTAVIHAKDGSVFASAELVFDYETETEKVTYSGSLYYGTDVLEALIEWLQDNPDDVALPEWL